MQELVPAYLRVPRRELIPVVLANTRNLLEAIHDPDIDRRGEQVDHRASGETRARQGITLDEMLHGWRIGLEVVREEAYARAEELDVDEDALLEFVEALLSWGDVGMRVSAVTHREAEVRELTRLAEKQAALRRVATLVAQGVPPAELFAVVAEQVACVLAVPVVRIVRYEPDGAATQLAAFGESERWERLPDKQRWSLDGGDLLADVRASGRPARIDDHAGLEGDVAQAIRRTGLRSTVASPIIASGEVWGAIVVSSPEIEPLASDTESRLTDFNELVTAAIAGAHARESLEMPAAEQAALRRVATLVARGAQPLEVFRAVNEEVARLLPVTSAAMGRYEPDGTCTTIAAWRAGGGHAFPVGDRWDCWGNHVTGIVLRTGRPARLDDFTDASGPIGIRGRDAGYRSAVGSPITVEGRLWGLVSAASTAIEPLPAGTEARLASFTELVGTAIANTESRSGLARLATEQAALRHIATMVARGSLPEEIFAKVAEEVALLLGVDSAGIDRYEPDDTCTVVASWGRFGDAFAVGSRWELHGNTVGAVVHRTGEPARTESYEHASGVIAGSARAAGLRSAVGSPIVVNGRLWGVIAVATSGTEPMPADAGLRIARFTELVATAIANVQARSDLAASRSRIIAAADEERRRVVRDLDEGARSHLAETIVTVEQARDRLEQGRPGAPGLVSEALRYAQAAMDELRELAHGILPSVLTTAGLEAGVTTLTSRMSIPVEVDVSAGRLPQAVEATAYFVVSEALTTIAEHAHAKAAKVTVRMDHRALRVDVCDDGVIGPPGEHTASVALRDRLAVLGGSLHVESLPRGGTRFTASIPVR